MQSYSHMNSWPQISLHSTDTTVSPPKHCNNLYDGQFALSLIEHFSHLHGVICRPLIASCSHVGVVSRFEVNVAINEISIEFRFEAVVKEVSPLWVLRPLIHTHKISLLSFENERLKCQLQWVPLKKTRIRNLWRLWRGLSDLPVERTSNISGSYANRFAIGCFRKSFQRNSMLCLVFLIILLAL